MCLGTFIWYLCVVQLEASLSLHMALRFSVTCSKNALVPVAGPGHEQRSIEKGKYPAVVDPCTFPPLLLTVPGCAIRCCGRTGAEMLMDAAEASIPQELSILPAGAFQSRVPSTAAEARCTVPLFKPSGLPCNWISLRVPFWLSVWKQNSVAKHYFFFMSLLLLLCQGSGINFGRFIKKSPFWLLSRSLKSSKANNETIGTEERNEVLGFILVTKFISLLFQLATRQTSVYSLWKRTLGMLWPRRGAVQQRALKVCSTFACIWKVQIRNRRICTRCWFHVQHRHFYKYAHPCTCSSVRLVNLSKLQRMPGKGHLQPISDSVIFVIISQPRFSCESFFFHLGGVKQLFLYKRNYFWGAEV